MHTHISLPGGNLPALVIELKEIIPADCRVNFRAKKNATDVAAMSSSSKSPIAIARIG